MGKSHQRTSERSYGKIARKTWRSVRFRKLTDFDQRLLLYLWTCPAGETSGSIFHIGLSQIADDLNTEVDQVKSCITRLGDSTWFQYDLEARVIFFPKQIEYDPPDNHFALIARIRRTRELPDTYLLGQFMRQLEPYVDRFTEKLSDDLMTYFRKCLNLPEQAGISYRNADGVQYGVTSGVALPEPEPYPEPTTKPEPSSDASAPLSPDASASAKPSGCNYDSIKNAWNDLASECGLSKVIDLTSKRKKSIQRRLAQKGFDVDELYEHIRNSPFLQGDNPRGWRCDFDFIWLSEHNFLKVLEGTYDDAEDTAIAAVESWAKEGAFDARQ